jgi:diguanylate cyclase (GGDEF)-like protein
MNEQHAITVAAGSQHTCDSLRYSVHTTLPGPEMAHPPLPAADANPESLSEAFVVPVCAELSEQTVRTRWRDVNRLLRLSTLSGQQMQLDATLATLCEQAREMISFERALAYYWNEKEEKFNLRSSVGVDDALRAAQSPGNLFNLWSVKHGQPMLFSRGAALTVNALLGDMESQSAVVVPIFVNNRVMGSLQFFTAREAVFSAEDIQLLWMMVRIAENLLARETATEGLIHFAFTDHLTGLRTRGYFEQQLELEIKRSERNQQPFVLLMLDIDHFKTLNDTYGHHAGDVVLKQVARILTADMREVDTVARYGGEEFVIVLPETTEDEGHAVAQRIRRSVEQAEYGHARLPGAESKKLSISIGLSVFDPKAKARTKRELVDSADSALYSAKSQGRNRVVKHRELRTA